MFANLEIGVLVCRIHFLYALGPMCILSVACKRTAPEIR